MKKYKAKPSYISSKKWYYILTFKIKYFYFSFYDGNDELGTCSSFKGDYERINHTNRS